MSKTLIYQFTLCCFLLSYIVSGQQVHLLNESLPCLGKHLNVAVHVTLDKTGAGNIPIEQIENLFEDIQPYFAPICLSFSFCSIDTIHNYSFDTLSTDRALKLGEHFNTDYMLNLFLVSEFGNLNPCHNGVFEGDLTPKSAYMIQPKECNAASLAHAIGHVLGLLDTNEGTGIELVDGSNCQTEGDLICDTPADPYNYDNSQTWVIDCKFVNKTRLDANGEYYIPQVANMMSPYYLCRKGFTREQFLLMVSTCQTLDFDLW